MQRGEGNHLFRLCLHRSAYLELAADDYVQAHPKFVSEQVIFACLEKRHKFFVPIEDLAGFGRFALDQGQPR